jgi:hypothetical protein
MLRIVARMARHASACSITAPSAASGFMTSSLKQKRSCASFSKLAVRPIDGLPTPRPSGHLEPPFMEAIGN